MSWTSLLSKPLFVEIEDLYLLAVPGTDKEYDPEAAEKKKKEAKDAAIAALEAASEASGDDDLYSSKMVFRVVNNVQVAVKGVHIRYEDLGASTGSIPHSFGITMKELSAKSANDDWSERERSAKTTGKETVAQKLLLLDRFGIYMDSQFMHSQRFSAIASADQVQQAFHTHSDDSSAYVVRPITSHGKVTINKKVDVAAGQVRPPTHDVELRFGDVAVVLSDAQYRGLGKMADQFSWIAKRMEHRHIRPAAPPAKNATGPWWRYAKEANVVDWRRKTRCWSWDFIKKRRDRRHKYVDLWVKHILHPKEDKKQTLAELDALHELLSIEDIKEYRMRAQARIPEGHGKSSWLGGWFSKKKPDEGPSAEEEKARLKALMAEDDDFDSESTDATWVGMRAKLALDKVSAELAECAADGALTTVMELGLIGIAVGYEQRPATGGDKAQVQLLDMGLSMVRHDGKLSNILRKTQPAEQLVALVAENKPLPLPEEELTPDLRVRLHAQPTELYVTAPGLDRIARFFASADSLEAIDVDGIYDDTVASIAIQQKALLSHVIENQQIKDIKLNVAAPRLVVPATDDADDTTLMTIIDLGMLKVDSRMQSNDERVLRSLSLEEVRDRAYEVYDIQLEGMQVLLAQRGDDWAADLSRAATPRHILDRIHLDIVLKKGMQQGDQELFGVRLGATLPTLAIRISDAQIAQLMIYGDLVAKEFAKVGQTDESAPTPTAAVGTANSNKVAVSQALQQKLVSHDEAYLEKKQKQRVAMARERVAHVDLKINHVQLKVLTQDKETADLTEFLEVCLVGLGLTAETRKWDQQVELYMSGIYVAHMRDAVANYLLKTVTFDPLVPKTPAALSGEMMSGADRFVSVEAIMCADDSPLFAAEFQSTATKANVKWGLLQIVLIQEQLLDLFPAIDRFVGRIEEDTASLELDSLPSLGIMFGTIEGELTLAQAMAKGMSEDVFHAIDVDNGGTISETEYTLYLAKQEAQKLGEADYQITLEKARSICPKMDKTMFEMVDLDDSGDVMYSELVAFMKLRGIEPLADANDGDDAQQEKVDSITLELDAEFESFSLLLCAKNTHLIEAELSQLKCEVKQTSSSKGDGMVANVILDALNVWDRTEAGELYPSIVAKELDTAGGDDSLLRVNFEDYVEAKDGFDSRVVVHASALKVHFLQRWLNEVLGFVDPVTKALDAAKFSGIAADIFTADPASKDLVLAVDTGGGMPSPQEIRAQVLPHIQRMRNNARAAQTPAEAIPSKMKLEVDLVAPIIVVPRSSSGVGCDTRLEIKLGKLNVHNEFNTDELDGLLLKETMHVSIHHPEIALYHHAATVDAGRKLNSKNLLSVGSIGTTIFHEAEVQSARQDEPSILIKLTTCVTKGSPGLPEQPMRIKVKVGKLILHVTDIDVPWLTSLAENNLAEVAVICPIEVTDEPALANEEEEAVVYDIERRPSEFAVDRGYSESSYSGDSGVDRMDDFLGFDELAAPPVLEPQKMGGGHAR